MTNVIVIKTNQWLFPSLSLPLPLSLSFSMSHRFNANFPMNLGKAVRITAIKLINLFYRTCADALIKHCDKTKATMFWGCFRLISIIIIIRAFIRRTMSASELNLRQHIIMCVWKYSWAKVVAPNHSDLQEACVYIVIVTSAVTHVLADFKMSKLSDGDVASLISVAKRTLPVGWQFNWI